MDWPQGSGIYGTGLEIESKLVEGSNPSRAIDFLNFLTGFSSLFGDLKNGSNMCLLRDSVLAPPHVVNLKAAIREDWRRLAVF